MDFRLESSFVPRGDQPAAIDALTRGVMAGRRFQTLLGVTGSGKTYTMANVIQAVQRPVLVISHNKTLAAQLYSEFKAFFPENAVEYFVSYYDYYQPEAYIPQTDTYIEKDASVNEDLDRLRLAATSSLVARRDTIVVASVSCIYGLGSPEEYSEMVVPLHVGDEVDRFDFLRRLSALQYMRNDYAPVRGSFRVRGSVVEVLAAYRDDAIRLVFDGDELVSIQTVDPVTGEVTGESVQETIFPAKHFVFQEGTVKSAIGSIEAELAERLEELRAQGKLLEAERLEGRTRYDIEMLENLGYCPGVENYSRHLSHRPPGSRPFTLIDYFPPDFLMIVDESHVTIPQIRGMYVGDHNRKVTLVDHGFRLPSALDNRPLRFEEFETLIPQWVFISATPAAYEMENSGRENVVEQIIRPTGLVDPPVEVRPATGQVKDLLGELRKVVECGGRALVTTLTKRLAEDVSQYIEEEGLSCTYLHSELDAIERVEVLRDLREGKFSIVVGVNLLREGLDLPEVTLVAVFDADREGFLRSATSLIQMIGRTARNVDGRVILYADSMTGAIRQTLDETDRRREKQIRFNEEHGITPETIESVIKPTIAEIVRSRHAEEGFEERLSMAEKIGELEAEMLRLADELKFEEAARIRDAIFAVQGRGGETRRLKGKGARWGKRRKHGRR
ncbi:MAG: excinuclease ABC subunit UvrB [Planctomycetes bacterium]|nr:excinuclease ABC subunit UvrB [Planctomycetota bacterium]